MAASLTAALPSWRNPFRLLLVAQFGLPALAALLFVASNQLAMDSLGTGAVVTVAASFLSIPLLVVWTGVTLLRDPQARSMLRFVQLFAAVLVIATFCWFAQALVGNW